MLFSGLPSIAKFTVFLYPHTHSFLLITSYINAVHLPQWGSLCCYINIEKNLSFMPNSLIPTCCLIFPVQVPSRRPVSRHISGLPLLRWPSDFPYFWWLWQHEGIASGHLVDYLTLGLFSLRSWTAFHIISFCWHDWSLLMLTVCPEWTMCGSLCHREAGGSFPISPRGRQSGGTVNLA